MEVYITFVTRIHTYCIKLCLRLDKQSSSFHLVSRKNSHMLCVSAAFGDHIRPHVEAPPRCYILNFKMAAALCPKTLEHIQVNYVGIYSINTHEGIFPHLCQSLIRPMHTVKTYIRELWCSFNHSVADDVRFTPRRKSPRDHNDRTLSATHIKFIQLSERIKVSVYKFVQIFWGPGV
jgi:hypothetical protein